MPTCKHNGSAAHVRVLVVGAGISGIGVACHLSRPLPGRSFTVLEASETFGGTWAVNRYPGVRSDSDMHTFGYSFKPWLTNELATADEILAYLAEVIEENDLARHIRYGHRVTLAAWSSDTRRWTVEVTPGGYGQGPGKVVFMQLEVALASAAGLGRDGGWRRRCWRGRPGAGD